VRSVVASILAVATVASAGTLGGVGSVRCPSGSKQVSVFHSVDGAKECMAEVDVTGTAGKVCAREMVGVVPTGQKALWDGCAFLRGSTTCFDKVKLVGGRYAGESGVIPPRCFQTDAR
jgi:hypothetical protein